MKSQNTISLSIIYVHNFPCLQNFRINEIVQPKHELTAKNYNKKLSKIQYVYCIVQNYVLYFFFTF